MSDDRIANAIDEETFYRKKQNIEWRNIEKKKAKLNHQNSTHFSKVSVPYIKLITI